MAHSYTPNPTNHPAAITVPDDGDLEDAASVDIPLEDLADTCAYLDNGNSLASLVTLAAQTGAVPGSKVYVQNNAWYMYAVSAPATADGYWIVTATGMGSGAWIREDWATVNTGHLAAVGVVPGGSYGGTAGRIAKDIVPYGVVDRTLVPSSGVHTTNATSMTELFAYDLGTVESGDIIDANISAIAGCAVDFKVATYISFDNGSTYTLMTPSASASPGVDPTYTLDAHYKSVVVGFQTLAAAGHCLVSVRAATTSGSDVVGVSMATGIIWIRRP